MNHLREIPVLNHITKITSGVKYNIVFDMNYVYFYRDFIENYIIGMYFVDNKNYYGRIA